MSRMQEILARRTSEVKQHADDRAARAAKKRAAFPGVAACIDEVTELFGPVATVPYGVEADGRSFGKPGPRGVTPVTESMPVTDAEPVRVNKSKGPRNERWWHQEEIE